jgi:glycosyltransferase involved in cell wall biosynthesis
MKLSVNILTWNCYQTLHDTLHNLTQDLKDIEHEIIIVDNGSTDGSQDLATIKNKENLGISIAKNQGIVASKGEYILLLDGDIVYMPGSIKCLMEWLEDNPKEYAIGFYPNRFTNQKNNNGQVFKESRCFFLHKPAIHTAACLFYGLYRKSMFDLGIKLSVDGPFAKVGYGWEDMDFYRQMRTKGINQWVAGINSAIGKYYHEINSSIRQMGHEEYIRTSRERAEYFKEKWKA